jgi:hypothetical protein
MFCPPDGLAYRARNLMALLFWPWCNVVKAWNIEETEGGVPILSQFGQ